MAQAQAAIRRKLLAAARQAKPARAKGGRALPGAWFMTDPRRAPHPEKVAARLPRGFGVIFRHFGAKDRFAAGEKLAQACRRRGVILLVSADPALASRIRADGVHWPEARLRGVRSRHPRWIETASAHSHASLARAARLGVDAAIVSMVFDGGSKSASRPMGAIRFRAMALQSPLPVYALGGISSKNAPRAIGGARTRAAGWAAIDAVMSGWSD